jgi:hypothetical protein
MLAKSLATSACNCTGQISWVCGGCAGDGGGDATHWLHACIQALMPRRMKSAKP